MTLNRKKRILIVDDDAHLLELLQQTLAALGYETRAASGGAEALDILTSDSFELMVTDIKMPNIDGISLLRKVRRHYPAMPVLFITGVASPEIIAAADPDGFLAKPFRISHIEELIEATISRQQETGNGRHGPRRILVVDADEEFREAVSEALSVSDYMPFAVASQTDALRELDNGRFDAVVADLEGTDDQPLDFVGHLRATHPELPIVLINHTPAAIEPALDGATGSLQKPFAMSEMITLLNDLVPAHG